MEYFIVFLPLLGAFIAGFFGNKFDQRYSQFMTSLFAVSYTHLTLPTTR